MTLRLQWPKPARWPLSPQEVHPAHRFVWQARPRLILPFWNHRGTGNVYAGQNARNLRIRSMPSRWPWRRLSIEKREGGQATRLWVDDLAGLLGLIEIGAVEFHPWNASIGDIEHPDMLVFELDPGEGVAWEFVIETALKLHRMLRDEGLEPWPKLTGGKGLHLMAPLDPKIDHSEARAYAKRIAQRLAATAPDRYTLSSDPGQRRGRIFIDYVRNGRGTTRWKPTIAPTSKSSSPRAPA